MTRIGHSRNRLPRIVVGGPPRPPSRGGLGLTPGAQGILHGGPRASDLAGDRPRAQAVRVQRPDAALFVVTERDAGPGGGSGGNRGVTLFERRHLAPEQLDIAVLGQADGGRRLVLQERFRREALRFPALRAHRILRA